MTDARSLANDSVHQLDRLAAAILDDVGDGPSPAIFAGLATEVRDTLGRVGVPAFNELTGLIAGIAGSVVAGTTDWSPSLGGTLMAAVDDLRTLVLRGAEFSAEDGEHLHHRATELAVYARSARTNPATTPAAHVPAPVAPMESSLESQSSPAAVVDEPSETVVSGPGTHDRGPDLRPFLFRRTVGSERRRPSSRRRLEAICSAQASPPWSG